MSVAVLLAGLAVALRLWILTAIPVIETDGVSYVAIARRFRESGSPFDALFHPVYPICIALLEPLAGDWETAGRVVSALFGAALIPLAFVFVRAVADRRVAALTALLLAVHPEMVRSSASVLSEATYVFLLVAAVWLGWTGVGARHPAFLPAAGLAFGLAYLVRPEAALYLGGFVALALVGALRAGRLRERGPWAAASLAAFLLVAAPYLLYLRRALGHWTLSGKIVHNLALDVGVQYAGGQTDAGFLLAHAGAVGRRLVENGFLFEKYALPELFPGILLLCLGAGLLAALMDGRVAPRWVLLAAAAPPFATLAFHVTSRVFLPTLPFVLPFAALGVLRAAAWLARGRLETWWRTALVVVLVAALAPYTLKPVLRPDAGGAVYRQAAQWIATTQRPDTVLMDRKPFVAFYSGRRLAPLPDVAPRDLAAVARGAGARLVILDSRVLDDRARLLPLVYAPPPPGLAVVRDFDPSPGERLRVLAVADRD